MGLGQFQPIRRPKYADNFDHILLLQKSPCTIGLNENIRCPCLQRFLPLGREGYCNRNVRLSGVCLSTFVRSDFSESVKGRKLKFGTNDVYITI